MRSGYYKRRISELVVLTDSTPVKIWSLALLLLLVATPWLASSFVLSHLTVIFITLIGVLGLHVLTGMTGLISVGHVAFLIIGAYAYAIAVTRFGVPPLAALLLSGIASALASLLVGVPSLRLRGLYLAITTLAFVYIVNAVVLAGGKFTGGARGISLTRPVILGVDLGNDAALYGACLIVAALALFGCLNLRRTYVGRALMAIRDNDIAASAMGVKLTRYKLTAFGICAFLTGIAGALLGIYIGFVTVEGFPFLLTIEALAILVVGGLGSVLGAVLGAVFIVTLPEALNFAFNLLGPAWSEALSASAFELKSMLYGLAIILFLTLDPRGLVGIWSDIRRLWVNWPLRY